MKKKIFLIIAIGLISTYALTAWFAEPSPGYFYDEAPYLPWPGY